MFSNEFKNQAFQVCLPCGLGRRMAEALESDSYNTVRFIIEDLLDDHNLYVHNNTGNNRQVKEEHKESYNDRVELYSNFMEMLTKKLDNGKLLPESGLRIQ